MRGLWNMGWWMLWTNKHLVKNINWLDLGVDMELILGYVLKTMVWKWDLASTGFWQGPVGNCLNCGNETLYFIKYSWVCCAAERLPASREVRFKGWHNIIYRKTNFNFLKFPNDIYNPSIERCSLFHPEAQHLFTSVTSSRARNESWDRWIHRHSPTSFS